MNWIWTWWKDNCTSNEKMNGRKNRIIWDINGSDKVEQINMKYNWKDNFVITWKWGLNTNEVSKKQMILQGKVKEIVDWT